MQRIVIASGPWVKTPGNVPHRLVLCAIWKSDKGPDTSACHTAMQAADAATGLVPEELVEWTQCVHEDGSISYYQGAYFPIRDSGEWHTVLHGKLVRFHERLQSWLKGHEPFIIMKEVL